MKFFKTKKFKIICTVLIIIFILYLILFISRINIFEGIITQINSETISVNIKGDIFLFDAEDALILNENNKPVSLSTLKIGDNICILNYSKWRGLVYQAVSFTPLVYNVWILKVID